MKICALAYIIITNHTLKYVNSQSDSYYYMETKLTVCLNENNIALSFIASGRLFQSLLDGYRVV